MMGSETDKIIKEILETLLRRYKQGLEKLMKGSEFIFDCVDILHCNLNKVSLNRGGSYIDFPEGLKNKNATINPKNNKDDNYSVCHNYCIKP